MNILFFGCLYSSEDKVVFLNKSKRGYQYAAQNLQEALVEGFLEICREKFTVLTIPSLSTFPKGCKLPVIKDSGLVYKGTCLGTSLGFLNLPFLNFPCYKRIDRFVDNWYESSIGDKTIFVYALLRGQMECAVRAKQRHPDIKISIIIPDLPMYMNCNRVYTALGLQKRNIAAIDDLVHEFDSYVVLAKHMTEALKIFNKPYIVIEGIFNALQNGYQEVVKLPGKTALYSGGLQTRYGVFDFIEAFLRLQGDDYRLLLCGNCYEMEKLNHYLAKDSRISYLGLVPTEKVRELQRQVNLLVNPRHSTEEFTKYSFPSKTIEYMASGTPVLMSPLPSMPDEYKEYLYLFDDESIDGMKTKLEATLNIEPEILKAKGKSASEYILKNKNSKVQVSKIIELLKNV